MHSGERVKTTTYPTKAGKFECCIVTYAMDNLPGAEAVRTSNPEFAKLVDILSSTYQEDGVPKAIRSQLKQAELRLRAVKQDYLEQQLLKEELSQLLQTTPQPREAPATTRSHDSSSCYITAAADLQHCLGVAPDVTLLGLQEDHLRAVVESVKDKRATKQAVHQSLEQRLRDKCCCVAHWHAPSRDTPTDHTLQLARVGQLPQLLSQQREEVERFGEEVSQIRTKNRELLARKHKVLSEMCVELKYALEQYKLVLTASANHTSLNYQQAQCQAMMGKLDVVHHQLLKGISADGRVQALEQIRSHLLSARQQLAEELSQTQQVIRSYESLGEEFTVLSQQYRELKEEVENRQWALTELGKSHV